MDTMRKIALTLVIIGAINWGLIGLFQFDLVATLFGGQDAGLSRIVYTLVGISGLFCLGLLFEPLENESNDKPIRNVNYSMEFGDEADITDKDKK